MMKLLPLLLAITVVATAGLAAAEPSSADKARARGFYLEGESKLVAGDSKAALAQFERADAIMGVPTTRYRVAQSLADLGRLVEARQVALTVRDIPPSREPNAEFDKARQLANELVDDLAGRIARVTFALSPASATVTVDGKPVSGEQLAGLDVDPGKHVLRAAAARHVSKQQMFEVKEGERRTLELELAPGEALGSESDLPSDAQQSSKTSTLAPSDGPTVSPLVWIGFGVGAAGLVAGAVSGGIALARGSDIGGRCPDGRCDKRDAALQDEHDAALVSAHVSTVSFAVAGAGVVVGIIGLFVDGDASEDAEAARWLPRIGPAGLGWGASF